MRVFTLGIWHERWEDFLACIFCYENHFVTFKLRQHVKKHKHHFFINIINGKELRRGYLEIKGHLRILDEIYYLGDNVTWCQNVVIT